MAYVLPPIREQLFIRPVWRSDAAKRRGPMMAYDSSFAESRRARDAEGVVPSGNMVGSSGNGDAVQQILLWARQNLSGEEVAKLGMELQSMSDELFEHSSREAMGKKTDPETALDAASLRKWRDYGANFARKFVADRAKASASAEQEYYERYPNARRLEGSAGCGGVTTAASAKPIAADASAERDYYSRFPHARRLG